MGLQYQTIANDSCLVNTALLAKYAELIGGWTFKCTTRPTMNDTTLMDTLKANGIREKDAALLIATCRNNQMGVGELK